MTTNAKKIAAWREENPGKALNAGVLLSILEVAHLHNADLRDANLRDADLRDVNLWGADLRDANLWDADMRDVNLRDANLRCSDLWGADLRGADLRCSNLWGADMRDVNLRDANLRDENLRDANLRVLTVDGLPSGRVALIPTCDGWDLNVGCWSGSVSDLEELIATNEGWPEASGEECDRRRPGLQALIALCRAHMDANADQRAGAPVCQHLLLPDPRRSRLDRPGPDGARLRHVAPAGAGQGVG